MSNNVDFGRIATLDLLRLFAALAVVLFHYLFRGAAADDFLTSGYPAVAPFAIYGYLGVDLFFLISGFVIAWSAEGRRWDTFTIARFARVYPGFLACMGISFAVMFVAATPQFPTSGMQLVANLFLFSPALGQPFMDGVYWSIVLEVVFYGWVALALLLGIFEKWKLQLITGWLALCMLNEFVMGSGAARMLFLTEYGPFFAGGILIHHLFSKGKSPEALLLLAASFMLGCNMMLIAQAWMMEHYGIAVSTPALLVANLFMYGLLIAAIRWRSMVPANATVLMLGGLTYPLYLLHQHIGFIAINRLAPAVGKWPAAALVLLLMMVLSWCVWRFVETPSRRRIITALNAVAERVRARLLNTATSTVP